MKVGFEQAGLESLRATITGMTALNKRATLSALSTVGFNLKKAAKDHIKNNSLGWPQVSKLSVLTQKYRAAGKTDNSRVSSAIISRQAVTGGVTRKIWGSLAGLLVYSVEKTTGGMVFGFASGTYGTKKGYTRSSGQSVRVANVIGQSAVDIAEKLTNGFSYVVGTGPKGDAQRRYFAALGIIVPRNTIMDIPARPLVGPTFLFSKGDIPIWFQTKFWERLKLYVEAGK